MAQYQPQHLIEKIEEYHINPQILYEAAAAAALDLPKEKYRRLAKTWAVRQHRMRSNPREE
jgi:predicted component of type VI protein secretion system